MIWQKRGEQRLDRIWYRESEREDPLLEDPEVMELFDLSVEFHYA